MKEMLQYVILSKLIENTSLRQNDIVSTVIHTDLHIIPAAYIYICIRIYSFSQWFLDVLQF